MQSRDYQLQSLLYNNPDAQVNVYLASIAQGTQEVVIKRTVHTFLEEANAVINEAMAQARLEHENICRILDCFLEQTPENTFQSVLVLERMTCDLGQEIKQRKQSQRYWSELELLSSLNQILSALCFAKSKGISHRDIKPQNIFLNQTGVLKLGDFGSASRQAALSQLQGVQGTPLYLSPELKNFYYTNMSNPTATPSFDPYLSDVYSLGVTFLYMTILEPPVKLMDTKNLYAATEEVLATLTNYPSVVQILRVMLGTEPQMRSSLEDLKQFVESLLQPQEYPGNQQYIQGNLEAIASIQKQNADPMSYQGSLQIRSGQQAYQPMAEECKLQSQTVRAEYNQYQANSYSQNSLVGGYGGGSTTVTTYQCSCCGSAFVYSAAYQRGDGFFLCSQQCKARVEAAYIQSTCAQCKGAIQDKTWWNTGKQQYPEYVANFQYFCSLRCFSGYVPIMPKPVEKNSCAWCEVEVVAKSLLDTSVVQLPCLHMFHDIYCVIRYFAAYSNNFQTKIDFVCPKCSLQIPSDIVEKAVALHNSKERQEDNLCYNCHNQKYKQVFECGHKLCENCIRTKEKTFLTIQYSWKEVCSICHR